MIKLMHAARDSVCMEATVIEAKKNLGGVIG